MRGRPYTRVGERTSIPKLRVWDMVPAQFPSQLRAAHMFSLPSNQPLIAISRHSSRIRVHLGLINRADLPAGSPRVSSRCNVSGRGWHTLGQKGS